MKELAAPEEYILPDQMQPFRIDTQGQAQEIHVTNEKGSGTVEIVKTGEENKPLTGVRCDVIRIADGSNAGELVTDESGLASMELPLGRYELKETATAPGYTLLSGSVSFLLKNSGETVRLPILNMKTPEKGGRIQVVKTERSSPVQPLESTGQEQRNVWGNSPQEVMELPLASFFLPVRMNCWNCAHRMDMRFSPLLSAFN